MSRQQREAVDLLLRQQEFDIGGEVEVQRRLFADLMSAIPLPDDVHTEDAVLGEVPVVGIDVGDGPSAGTILYFHGGGYAIGSAALSAGLASQLARQSGTRAVSVDYALAPERPYPAAVQDAVAAYRGLLATGVAAEEVVLAGESAGGGLAITAAVAINSLGLPRPAAIYVASPWVDLTTSGASMTTKVADDPSLTPEGMRRRAREYANGQDLASGGVSPLFARLSGLPPLLVQVGGNETLLDDATRLAARAAADGVAVTLEVTPDVPHVFVGFAGMLDEADVALLTAGRFIRTRLDRKGD